ncbi:tryptophan--tRNA ligase [Pseudoalteromonas tunicata]|jgi:tryptophanyl-tRNA synthetase|uniref:Tryptophan--tRNA ligase n=1 Tax=Pseudoalteromonas tunicata D2 TaxID=87626 RepID=A4C9H4_9GAMM|nr:tryptophan--tRNA ligase [Pseudoalteromonas tunicata]ATC94579.1 tryptophanyl-tRNA synthetase [Pseudoalteromonas tunicata]AXT30306.1 tryptophan--tRNA ligase [Pseudoalteromonas tunicata]EAR28032.1 tryptophanyl-tRNA synthetase [Pseudoalteromonas tunicata D2]
MNHKILTGDRPTGPLHLGHYVGSLKNRIELQNHYSQTILIADLQGLTDNSHNPEKVSSNILNVLADYLAVGICPTKTTICLQSALPALSELTMFYANLVSVSRLERNPTVKAEIASKEFGSSIPVGFFSYPISQAADITAFDATLVPVGDDQLPMIEITNEIVRKLNNIAQKTILTQAKPLLSDTPRLPGVDGKAKMSKSLGNVITFGSSDDFIVKAVRAMYTDPNHLRVDDPGQVEGNVVFTYLDAFHEDKAFITQLKNHYAAGGLGDTKLKGILADCLINLITPIRAKRALFLADRGELIAILKSGTELANQQTQTVAQRVKSAFGLNLF